MFPVRPKLRSLIRDVLRVVRGASSFRRVGHDGDNHAIVPHRCRSSQRQVMAIALPAKGSDAAGVDLVAHDMLN